MCLQIMVVVEYCLSTHVYLQIMVVVEYCLFTHMYLQIMVIVEYCLSTHYVSADNGRRGILLEFKTLRELIADQRAALQVLNFAKM